MFIYDFYINMSNNWVQYPSTSNLLKKTYIKDFLDVSGEMYIRNGSMNISGNITTTGELTCKNLSLTSGALDSGINSDVQTALDGKQATLTAGSNITIDGSTISSSGGLTGVSEATIDGNDTTLLNGNALVEGDLNVTGNVIVNGTTVHTSDDRLKINETVIDKGLEYINQLTPQIYDKKEAFDINISKKDSGLIAQDIWYKTPELRHLVKTPEPWKIKHMELGDTINPDPSYNDYGWSNKTPAAVNYIGIIAYLVKSIKELNNKYIENKELIDNYKASKNA
jgi:hypothetical protein